MNVKNSIRNWLLPKEGNLSYEDFMQLSFKKHSKSWLLEINEQSNHPKYPYVNSIALVTNNFELLQVDKIFRYWRSNDLTSQEKYLSNSNWMYYACLKYSFLSDLKEYEINIKQEEMQNSFQMKLNKLNNKKLMNYDQIEEFTNNNPIVIKNYKILNGFHRVFAMIGWILKDNNYLPISYNKYHD